MSSITKGLSRKIMKRSRLRKNFLQKKTEETCKISVKQRNKCVSLLEKGKKEYCQNLHEKNVIDNKTFWKTVKPLISDKLVPGEKKISMKVKRCWHLNLKRRDSQ